MVMRSHERQRDTPVTVGERRWVKRRLRVVAMDHGLDLASYFPVLLEVRPQLLSKSEQDMAKSRTSAAQLSSFHPTDSIVLPAGRTTSNS